MASFQEYRRRFFLPLAGLALALYYVFAFVPLTRRASSLDEPLRSAWTNLAAAVGQTNAASLDFRHITNQLADTRQALTILETTRKRAITRLDLSPEVRARMSAPFQLVDYQNERGKQIDLLDQAAKREKITVDPMVFTGFPEHTADVEEPALLWAALSFVDSLCESALNCKIMAIHSLEVPLALTNAPGADTAGRWAELPVQIEFTASAENAVRLLRSLPLRAEELRPLGLPEASPGKTPLFIDRLIIRKQNPEKLDEVRVWLRAVGFVLRDS